MIIFYQTNGVYTNFSSLSSFNFPIIDYFLECANLTRYAANFISAYSASLVACSNFFLLVEKLIKLTLLANLYGLVLGNKDCAIISFLMRNISSALPLWQSFGVINFKPECKCLLLYQL